jgi:DNA polymerase sigma
MIPMISKPSKALFSDDIIAVVGPTYQAAMVRDQIFDSIKKFINYIFISTYPGLTCSVYMYGSVPLKTFLVDSDIDISLIISDESGIIQPPLCYPIYSELIKRFEEVAAANSEITGIHSIMADVQVIKMQWYSVPIDITLQQYSACIAYNFLEMINQMMGKEGLFKCSIILIKSWCLYESHILGSQNGNLCSYAIEVMILYILNNYYDECYTPLDVLSIFIKSFASFEWDKQILTIFGPISITNYNKELPTVLFPIKY